MQNPLSRAFHLFCAREHSGETKMAVLAVWDKLVSGCISLRTGKFTGNSPFSVPLLRVRYAANPKIS